MFDNYAENNFYSLSLAIFLLGNMSHTFCTHYSPELCGPVCQICTTPYSGNVKYVVIHLYLFLVHLCSLESGSVMRFFGVFFFRKSNPPGPLISRQNWFWWKIRFRGDIRLISDSALTNTARSFAVAHFVFSGLSLPWKRILNN